MFYDFYLGKDFQYSPLMPTKSKNFCLFDNYMLFSLSFSAAWIPDPLHTGLVTYPYAIHQFISQAVFLPWSFTYSLPDRCFSHLGISSLSRLLLWVLSLSFFCLLLTHVLYASGSLPAYLPLSLMPHSQPSTLSSCLACLPLRPHALLVSAWPSFILPCLPPSTVGVLLILSFFYIKNNTYIVFFFLWSWGSRACHLLAVTATEINI